MATISAKDVQATLDQFQQALLDLDSNMSGLRQKQEWTVEEACEVYSRILNFKAQLSALINDQENYLIDFMETHNVEVVLLESGESLSKEMPRGRKGWQHKDLARAVAERIQVIAIDLDTGERTMTTGEMIESVLEYVQPSYWRVGALANIGLNADSFCEVGNPEPKLSIRKVK